MVSRKKLRGVVCCVRGREGEGGGGGLNQFYSRETLPIILMQLHVYKGSSISPLKHYSETYIITNNVMKQIIGLSYDLKPKHKKRITMSPTTDIV